MSPAETPFSPEQRPTVIGSYGGAKAGTSRTRQIPVPWIDCAPCGWRHYPSTSRGAWHLVTTCVSCGEPLPAVIDHTDEESEV